MCYVDIHRLYGISPIRLDLVILRIKNDARNTHTTARGGYMNKGERLLSFSILLVSLPSLHNRPAHFAPALWRIAVSG